MAAHAGKDTAIELLLEQAERIEPGLVVLASRLRLDENVELDALLRDTLGYPVVVLLCRSDIATELGRMAAVAAALQRGRYLLAHLFGERGGLDPSLRPRFVLLASRFPDNAASLLDMMSGVEVQAFEYRLVSSAVGRPVLDLASFHRTSGPAFTPQPRREPALTLYVPHAPTIVSAPPPSPPAPPAPQYLPPAAPALPPSRAAAAGKAPPPAAPAVSRTPPLRGAAAASAAAAAAAVGSTPAKPAPPAAPRRLPEPLSAARSNADDLQLLDDELQHTDSARSFFQRARESIRSLSSHVTESSENGQVRYQVKDKTLATLTLDPQGFRLRVGDQGGSGMTVADEATFNASLNSVFTLYFDRLGPDRP